MKKQYFAFLMLAGIIITAGCGGPKKGTEEGDGKDTSEVKEDTTGKAAKEGVMSKKGLTLVPFKDSPEYNDAKLNLKKPAKGAELDTGEVAFSYKVTNYKLGEQTPGAKKKSLANSGNGQHIHQIVNNKPYTAHYKPDFKKRFETGRYVALSFLARSYHESVKNPNAYDVRQFTVGSPENADSVDLTKPHMFYSRPKGTYSGEATNKVLLDFYLINAKLSSDGKKVRATINGKSFMLDKWQPYLVKGLPKGENTFKLEFLNDKGKLVESPFNPVKRTVTLKK